MHGVAVLEVRPCEKYTLSLTTPQIFGAVKPVLVKELMQVLMRSELSVKRQLHTLYSDEYDGRFGLI